MLFLWIAASVQKVVLLDDLGLLEPKGATGRPAPGSLFQKSRGAQEGAYNSRRNVLHSTHMQNGLEADARQAIRQYLAREYARPLGIGDRQMQEIKQLAANRNTLESRGGSRGNGRHIDTRAGGKASKQGTFPQIPGSIDIDVPYRSQEGSPGEKPGEYSGNIRGIETGAKSSGGHLPSSRSGVGADSNVPQNDLYSSPARGTYTGAKSSGGHLPSSRSGVWADSTVPQNDLYSSPARGADDSESAKDFERSARESIENANSARESYLEVKIRESRGREGKIEEELSKVEEQIEALISSLGETRMKAQNTQIDLLNRRNSVKNMIARKEASEKAVRKLSAEMRILNNEVVRLSKELDDKRIRLENLGEDVNMQNNRVRSIEDELMSRNSEVEQDEAKKNDLNKDIIRIENAIAKLKEEREGLAHEKSRESRVQAKLQREIDKIGEAGAFV